MYVYAEYRKLVFFKDVWNLDKMTHRNKYELVLQKLTDFYSSGKNLVSGGWAGHVTWYIVQW